MLEKYHMYHYELGKGKKGLPIKQISEFDTSEVEKFSSESAADFQLSGYVDVLNIIPQPDDQWKEYMYLQSFSSMYSGFDYFTDRENSDTYLIVYTVSGNGKLEYQGQNYELHPTDIFWIDCHNRHLYATQGEFWEHMDLHLNGHGVLLYYQEFIKRNSPVIKGSDSFMKDLEKLLDSYSLPSPLRSMMISHHMETLMTNLIMHQQKQNEEGLQNNHTIKTLIAYINRHYQEQISLDDLSDICGISKFHLSREFKKLTGFPPNEYIINLRLEHAKRMLDNTSLNVKEIAQSVGIENEAYFSRLFRNRTGISPNTYRNAGLAN
ncbi:MAG: helix-turn-helix domain-containing protein [Erysipelotrichaceae bacterium]|nr:helix-turn-helix domain-containing protein [Erysipelotrichaceae bacterium]